MNTVRGRGIVSILLPNSATSMAILCGQGNLEIQNANFFQDILKELFIRLYATYKVTTYIHVCPFNLSLELVILQ